MDQLKSMKEQLISVVQSQLGHLDSVDAKELGEVVDMIKDLSEACYYCSITEAMEEGQEKGGNTYYYTMPYDDYNRGRMYYSGGQGNGNSGHDSRGNSSSNSYYGRGQGSRYYTQPGRMNPIYYSPDFREYEWEDDRYIQRDPREGRARESRRMYMESKEMHKDSATQMKELENYIHDLSDDITEMIANATPEEKQVLQQKIATLSTKIK